ncbi:hypothetical protein E4U23_006277, partial [Claviceps purpurea]
MPHSTPPLHLDVAGVDGAGARIYIECRTLYTFTSIYIDSEIYTHKVLSGGPTLRSGAGTLLRV